MKDALTALPNHSLFDDRLQLAIRQARRYRRHFALMVVALSHVGEASAQLGETDGNQLIVEMAKRLSSCVRESDTVARLDDDTFAIVLGETATGMDIELVARRAGELLAEPCYLDTETVCVIVGIGIALFPQHGDNADQLMRTAAAALQEAKAGVGDGYRIHMSVALDATNQTDLI